LVSPSLNKNNQSGQTQESTVPVLFAAAEFEDYDLASGAFAKETTSYIDSAYSRCAVGLGFDTTSYLQGNFSTPVSSFWFTCRTGSYNTTAGYVPFTFLDGSNDRLRLKVGSTAGSGAYSSLQLYRWDGTSETLIGSLANAYYTSTQRFDFKVVYSSTGSVEVYRSGTLFGTITGDLVGSSGSTTLTGVKLKSAASSGVTLTAYSEVVAATGSTLGMRVKTLTPNANGDLTGWTGTFGNIDEITPSDTDVINSATAAQEWSCNMTGMPTGSSGQKVRAVRFACEAAKGDTGPSAIALGVRTGGSTSYQSNQACSLAYATHRTSLMETNPVTGQPWTTTELDAIQMSFRSA
jgi:hypothetical protein